MHHPWRPRHHSTPWCCLNTGSEARPFCAVHFHAKQEEGDVEATLDEPERALLVGVGLQHSGRSDRNRDVYSSDESLEELSSLAQSAGLQVCCAPHLCSTHAHAAVRESPAPEQRVKWQAGQTELS